MATVRLLDLVIWLLAVAVVAWITNYTLKMFVSMGLIVWPWSRIVPDSSAEPLRPGRPSPIFLTTEQSSIVTLAVRRYREVAQNPILDDADVLVRIAQEYLREADSLARLAAAQRTAATPVKRRIALED